MTPLGFNNPLYILPFDHRGSFQKKMFGWNGPLSAEQTNEIAGAKRVIYDAFKNAIEAGVPKEKAGILVDEQFGAEILRDASAEGYVTACPAEKSGQDEFDFGNTLPKIGRLCQMVKDLKPGCEVEVDGGVDASTVPLAAAAGANVFVAGSSIFGSTKGMADAMADLGDLIACVTRAEMARDLVQR